ncbi:MAG: hypothetical protein CGU28_00575 [Candidatus Dactylopiibacterium carminicum]|uniref:STAS domain-containing protein n=1 Tax=Candidatus Dactylopiibacterium carminicum TaxID=857335 RepID=A0A272EYX0_9RHOO|nr:STAS domain-containing protein [Candidatus Dactylopiibacterium carminicum]KAF7600810.1 STAS domain-containing protein [Candidatus Dactylopiibacterium carminicum]PAS95309.1 MAG: hypothetical protein CGU29_00235 [Candidatus Dactylopiibacterium carminicum]PAS98679.1 MAG: hypothetical protein CGU28_00575 [Candidatus Dactylopiibacterium carminicum]
MDLSGITRIDTAGVQLLLQLSLTAQRTDARLDLHAPSLVVRELVSFYRLEGPIFQPDHEDGNTP